MAENELFCESCSIAAGESERMGCVTCGMENLCQDCGLIHCRLLHFVRDPSGLQPTLCPVHKCFFTVFCNECNIPLCSKCVSDHLKHERVTMESKIEYSKSKLEKFMLNEAESRKPVLSYLDKLKFLRSEQERLKELWRSRKVINEALEISESVANGLFDSRQPDVAQAIAKTSAEVHRIESLLEESSIIVEGNEKLLLSAKSEVLKSSKILTKSPLANFTPEYSNILYGLGNICFDRELFRSKLEKLLAECITFPNLPELIPNIEMKNLFLTELPVPAYSNGLMAVSNCSLIYSQEKHPNKLFGVNLVDCSSFDIPIPVSALQFGPLKAIISSATQGSFFCQFGRQLFKFSGSSFKEKPVARLSATEVVVALTDSEFCTWKDKPHYTLTLKKQWSQDYLERHGGRNTFFTRPSCPSFKDEICAFLVGNKVIHRGAGSPGHPCPGFEISAIYSAAKLDQPYLSYCFALKSTKQYYIIHGIDRDTGKYVIRRCRHIFGENTCTVHDYDLTLDVDRIFPYIEYLPQLSQLLCVDSHGHLEVVAIPWNVSLT